MAWRFSALPHGIRTALCASFIPLPAAPERAGAFCGRLWSERYCIYVAVGQKRSTVAQIVELLRKNDAMKPAGPLGGGGESAWREKVGGGPGARRLCAGLPLLVSLGEVTACASPALSTLDSVRARARARDNLGPLFKGLRRFFALQTVALLDFVRKETAPSSFRVSGVLSSKVVPEMLDRGGPGSGRLLLAVPEVLDHRGCHGFGVGAASVLGAVLGLRHGRVLP